MTEALALKVASWLWLPAIGVIGYFVKQRDDQLKKVEDKLATKLSKEDVKDLIDLSIAPLQHKVDRANELSMENTLLLREVSHTLNALARDVAVQTALNNHKQLQDN